ncbi:CMRF35-like molecule 8 isoform X2 [Sardina pilchardus]|uniref:CMRF35-like molecule 8 isoform X2 n=1 Tax=Sardina pilchardus TaxID=27697 RepID=UPI002E130704
MRMILWIFSLCLGFSCVTMQRDGSFVRGIEGQSVEVVCPYPTANYKSTPKYFCRAPCWHKDNVLVKSVETNVSVSKGRYSLNDNTSSLYFSISIRGLTAQDSGSYYCGFDQWGIDRYIKVFLHIVNASASNSSVSTPEPRAHKNSTTNNRNRPLHSTVVLVSCVLLSLVILYRKRTAADESSDPVTPESPAPQAVDGDVHLYTGVCDPDPGQPSVQSAESAELYFLLQPPDPPAGGHDELYSLVTPH